MSKRVKKERVRDFRVTLTNDMTHNELGVMRFTRSSFLLTVASFFLVLLVGIYCLIAFTPLRTYIPGYPDEHTKRAAIQNVITIDSLENVITRWQLYAGNLDRIIKGEAPLPLDSILRIQARQVSSDADKAFLASRDSILRDRVQKAEQFQVGESKRDLPVEGMHFFVPVKGVVSKRFNQAISPWIEITVAAGGVVKAIQDGTVVFAGWDQDSGYTLILQHPGDLVSVYRNNDKLLKSMGSQVSAGSPISMAGGDDKNHGDILRFELWHKGEALDPMKFISF